MEKGKLSYPYRESNPDPSVVQRYADRAIPAQKAA
jgi:hypothetical protein